MDACIAFATVELNMTHVKHGDACIHMLTMIHHSL